MASVLDILIVGDGFSGTTIAAHLLRRATGLSVGILDRGGQPGRGLAYSSPHRFHLLNVPAGNMSALPDDSEHFLRWAQRNYDASSRGEAFCHAHCMETTYPGCLSKRSRMATRTVSAGFRMKLSRFSSGTGS